VCAVEKSGTSGSGQGSGGHFEIEVEAEEKKDDVGGPGSDGGRQLSDATHGFHECRHSPIENTDTDTGGYAADGAATADDDREGNREKHADGRDERVSEFFLPLNGEGRSVKAGATQAVDVAAEIAPAHLKGLDDFAIEIRGRLNEFGESGDDKGRVVGDGGAGEIADPAGFEDPGFFVIEPAGAVGENAAANLKGSGIELDDAESAEELLGGIEQIVIVDLGISAEDPALRVSVGLRGFVFDLVAQGVLTLVGVGKIGVVEDEQSGSDGQAGEENGKGNAIKADAAGFEGGDFVVLAEDAEGDEDSDESAERRELIDQIGNEVAEIVDDHDERDVMAGDVVEEFEEGENFKEGDEGGHDDEEKIKKAAEDIHIDDGGNVPGGRAGGTVFAASGRFGQCARNFLTAHETPERHEAMEKGEGAVTAVHLHARKEGDADEGEDDVGDPDTDEGGKNALAR